MKSSVFNYVESLNELYRKTGFLVKANTGVYRLSEKSGENELVGILKWDNNIKQYYIEYVD